MLEEQVKTFQKYRIQAAANKTFSMDVRGLLSENLRYEERNKRREQQEVRVMEPCWDVLSKTAWNPSNYTCKNAILWELWNQVSKNNNEKVEVTWEKVEKMGENDGNTLKGMKPPKANINGLLVLLFRLHKRFTELESGR